MSELNGDGVKYEEFRTSSGKTVMLQSVSPLLIQKVNATIQDPKPPTYKMDTLLGEEVFEYDEKSIQDETATNEDRAAWKKYTDGLEEAERKRREKLIDILFTKGIVIEVPDDGWEEEQRFLGAEVPENPIARRIHYIQTEVFTSAQDLTDAIAKLMQLTAGITEEDMVEIRQSFRGALQGAPAEGLASEDDESKPRRRRGRPKNATAEGVDV